MAEGAEAAVMGEEATEEARPEAVVRAGGALTVEAAMAAAVPVAVAGSVEASANRRRSRRQRGCCFPKRMGASLIVRAPTLHSDSTCCRGWYT